MAEDSQAVHQDRVRGEESLASARPHPGEPFDGADAGGQRQWVHAHNAVTGNVVGPVVQAGVLIGDVHQHLPGREPPVPQQLPPCPAGFVGRAEEQAVLTAALDQVVPGGPVLISALAGAGGIGKTWLALRWAHQHADRFPDGQLFVDLRGFSPTSPPMPPGEAVRGFLDAFGADPGPSTLDDQVRLYRSLVAGKQMLVVLDNAADDRQIEPLLPGSPSCTVLVTSRNTLTKLVTLNGARHLRLTILSPHEAHALLLERLGDGDPRVRTEPGAAAELIHLCGRYPLALSIIAARAQTRRGIPLAEFAAELRELRLAALDSAVSLPAVLSLSLRDIPPHQHEAFALLGISPGPDTGLPAVASLTGLPTARTRIVLEALEDASLLERHPGGRYGMHDLIRDYATTIAHQDLTGRSLEAALRRVLDFYIHTAHNAARLLRPHGPPIRLDPLVPGVQVQPLRDIPAAMAWFDTEHACLLAAQRAAVDHAWHQMVWHVAWFLYDFQYWRGHRHDRLAAWQAALEASAHLPDPLCRVRALRHVGSALTDLGHFDEGIENLQQALALSQQHDDAQEQAHTHQVFARGWERRGDDRRALEHARQALDLFGDLGQAVSHANMLNAVGWLTARLGDCDTAYEHCQTALTLHRQHHSPGGEAKTLDSLGYISDRAGRHQQAIGYYQQAITLADALANTTQSADTRRRIGHAYAALGQYGKARTVWREAIRLYQQQGRTVEAARAQQHLDDLDQPAHPGTQQSPGPE